MKSLIFLVSFFISISALAQVEVKSDGSLGAKGSYPAMKLGAYQAGAYPVETLVERNAIPAYLRATGMLVYVADSAKYYSLPAGITNSDWAEFNVQSIITGANNYVPKLMGTSLLSSGIYDASGDIGIGLTAPTAKLHVAGAIASRNADGSPIEVKAAGEGSTGVFNQIHNDTTGYLFHLVSGRNMANNTALIGLGVGDVNHNFNEASSPNITGLIISNKRNGRGMSIHNQVTSSGYAFYGVHEGAGAFMHVTNNGASSPALQFDGVNSLTSGTPLIRAVGSAVQWEFQRDGRFVTNGVIEANSDAFFSASNYLWGSATIKGLNGAGSGWVTLMQRNAGLNSWDLPSVADMTSRGKFINRAADGSAITAKINGDGTAGLINLEHDDTTGGYLYHLTTGQHIGGGGALIGLGVGDGSVNNGLTSSNNMSGLLISNKSAGKGISLANTSTSTGYGLYGVHQGAGNFMHLSAGAGATGSMITIDGANNITGGALMMAVGTETLWTFAGDGTATFNKDVNLNASTFHTNPVYLYGGGTLRGINAAGNAWVDIIKKTGDNWHVANVATVTTSDDIEITDNTKGIILKSPDGTRYRVKVANGGTLTVTAL